MKNLLTIIALASAAGCATAPQTMGERSRLDNSAQATLQQMEARDAGLQGLLGDSPGYVVFPNIGKGGAIVGAAYGRGVLYEHGKPIGFVSLTQGSLGAQLGGQTLAELIVFRDRNAIDLLKAGRFELGGNVSAVALTEGAAASANFSDGVAVFEMPHGGLMAEISVSGQQLSYQAG